MTAADNIYAFHLGNNAYGKPATALNILRETILGRKLFDKAFKTYSERWAFKHPKPADFFRSIEDVSGVDLDWFWRGWFYSTDPVDIAIDTVTYYKLNPTQKEEMAPHPFLPRTGAPRCHRRPLGGLHPDSHDEQRVPLPALRGCWGRRPYCQAKSI